ncbi:MAG: hypothetical protein ACXIUZ_05285 [Lysobacteraceae bacterium]
MRHARLVLLPALLALAACGAPDGEPPEELPLPPDERLRDGEIQGRVGGDASGPGWRACAFPVEGGEPRCAAVEDGRFVLAVPGGRYQVLAYGPGGLVAAHTASTTCLRDGGVDCTDGRLLEVEIAAEATLPSIDVLDFDNRLDDWPDAP